MELILLWITTIIISHSIQLNHTFRMFKDVADEGYKIDASELKKVLDEIDPDSAKKSKLKLLMPFYNIFYSMDAAMKYIQYRDMVLNQLDILGTIDKMSEWESIEYNKKPTGFNAFLSNIKYEIKLSKAPKLTLEDPEGSIWFTLNNETKELIILKTEGYISSLSLEEQKRVIEEEAMKLEQIILENYGSIDSLKEKLKKSNGTIELKKNPTTKSPREQIEELQNLKDEYTEVQEPDNKENGYSKTNKKQ